MFWPSDLMEFSPLDFKLLRTSGSFYPWMVMSETINWCLSPTVFWKQTTCCLGFKAPQIEGRFAPRQIILRASPIPNVDGDILNLEVDEICMKLSIIPSCWLTWPQFSHMYTGDKMPLSQSSGYQASLRKQKTVNSFLFFLVISKIRH